MAKVKVRERETGRERLIPEHWLTHPTLGEPFEAIPEPDGPSGNPLTDEELAAAQAVSNADQTQRRARRGREE